MRRGRSEELSVLPTTRQGPQGQTAFRHQTDGTAACVVGVAGLIDDVVGMLLLALAVGEDLAVLCDARRENQGRGEWQWELEWDWLMDGWMDGQVGFRAWVGDEMR